MKWLWIIPPGAQGLLMAIDEFRYHRRRQLPFWERIGHPIDTLSFLACLMIPLMLSPDRTSISIYAGLSIFSSLLITKDEFIHATRCSPQEHWLHAVLFLLHPVVLLEVGWLWATRSLDTLIFMQSLAFGCLVIAGFLFYQLTYWLFPRSYDTQVRPSDQ